MPDDLTRPMVRPLTRPLERDARGQVIYPSLWQAFDKANRLRDAARIGPELTFSRSSTATYFDSSGILQTASTDEPRFDHDPATGDPLGLLIEESRTNRVKYRNDPSNWDSTAAGQEQTSETAPDGDNDTWRVDFDASGSGRQAKPAILTDDNTNSYTFSIYLKKGPSGIASFRLKLEESGGDFTNYSTKDITLTDTWQRFEVSGANEADGNGIAGVVANQSGSAGDCYVWGAQFEQGAFATSVIETAGSEVTRSADVAKVDNSFIGSARTFVAEFTLHPNGGSESSFVIRVPVEEGVGYGIRIIDTGEIVFYRRGSSSDDITDSAPSGFVRAAIADEDSVDNSVLVVDGTKEGEGNEALTFTTKELFIGAFRESDSHFNGHIASLTYYPSRLSDEELKRLTS